MNSPDLQTLLPEAPPWRGLPLTALDTALASFLQQAQPSSDPRHLWLAALTHHQWARGHACLELNALGQDAAQLLGWTPQQAQALPADLSQAADTLPWLAGAGAPLVLEHARLYLRRAWIAEHSIRTALRARCQPLSSLTELPISAWGDELFEGLGQDETALAQSCDQRRACLAGLHHGLTLVSGGPGTGKTTTVARMLALMQRVQSQTHPDAPLRMWLSAPTGKASMRLAQAMQSAVRRLPSSWGVGLPNTAATLHRLLSEHQRVWEVDVLVIDEVSMVDLELMAQVLTALPAHARLILLGDPNQLASVEAGSAWAQLCAAPWLHAQHVQLIHSHRFQADQGIGLWARWVQQGDLRQRHTEWQALPLGWTAPGHAVTRLGAVQPHTPAGRTLLQLALAPWWQAVQAALQTPVSDEVARQLLDRYSQVGVLCATREGPWGVQALNRHMALALGLDPHAWAAGRPVMVTRNLHGLGLMNGDIGLCLPHVLANGQVALRVAFAHHEGVRWISPARLDAVETVFAMTVHKSQGSEFDHVLLVLPDRSNAVLSRELIYTGVTRAKERLTWWVPEPEVLALACQTRVARSGGLTDA
jgi:exodeoxyribonuclease V alpha subunit